VVLDDIWSRGAVDTAVAAFGVLGDQDLAERDGGEVARILHTDFTAQAVLLTELSARMTARGSGRLVAFSSIAGARVRRPNYVYGSAKAGLDGFCQGMQDALRGTGVTLTVVRPGFVIGRMTTGMDPAPLSTTPDVVAEAVVTALERGRTDVWVPRALGLLATVMRLVPRPLWRLAPR
jgi:short-subunit dehydrogenase